VLLVRVVVALVVEVVAVEVEPAQEELHLLLQDQAVVVAVVVREVMVMLDQLVVRGIPALLEPMVTLAVTEVELRAETQATLAVQATPVVQRQTQIPQILALI
jgi:hypothetical protein